LEILLHIFDYLDEEFIQYIQTTFWAFVGVMMRERERETGFKKR
jgi:hypothetical protein